MKNDVREMLEISLIKVLRDWWRASGRQRNAVARQCCRNDELGTVSHLKYGQDGQVSHTRSCLDSLV